MGQLNRQLVVCHDNIPLILIDLGDAIVLKSAVLDWYAENYAFERQKLSGFYIETVVYKPGLGPKLSAGQHLSEPQVGALLGEIEKTFPEAYGYTDQDTYVRDLQTYLVFRNREESFAKTNAIARIHYKLGTQPCAS